MEPRVGESLAENLKPAMAQAYGMSALHCITVSLALGGPGLGSGTFGPSKYEALATEAGFASFKLVGNNAMNNFYELKAPGGALPAAL